MNNKIHKIRLEVLSPIHIGSGRDIEPYEYILMNDGKNVVMMRYVFSNFAKKCIEAGLLNIEELKLINKRPLEVRKKIYNLVSQNLCLVDPIYVAGVSSRGGKLNKMKVDHDLIFEHYIRNINSAVQGQESNQLQIKEFVGQAFGKYIPGSSIKGALRTALVNESFYSDKYMLEEKKAVLNDYFCELKVSDTNLFYEGLKIGRTDRMQNDSNNYCEYLEVGTKLEFDIAIDTKSRHFDIEKIRNDCRKFFGGIMGELEEGLEKYNSGLRSLDKQSAKNTIEKNNKMLEQIGELIDLKLENNDFIINLGFGGGELYKKLKPDNGVCKFFPTNQDFKNNELLRFLSIPYTRWRLEGKMMGFAKCTIYE